MRGAGLRHLHRSLICPIFAHCVGLRPTPAVGSSHYTEDAGTRILLSLSRAGAKVKPMKLIMTILLAACVTGCLGNGGNIPHEDSEGATPHNEGAPLCRDGTPPPCVIRN